MGPCKINSCAQCEGAFSFQITPGKVSAPFTAWAEGPRPPPLLPQHTVAQKETPSAEETNPPCRGSVAWGVTLGPRDTAVPSHSLSPQLATLQCLKRCKDIKRKGEGKLPKSNPSNDKTKARTSCKSCGKRKQQTFQEQVKHDPKYSITESKCYISMGSLKQVDPDVTAAPKAAQLQDTLLVHFLTPLHPCLWALGKGGSCFITVMSLLGMGNEVHLGLGPWAGGLPPELHGQPLLQQLPQQVCQGDGPWRAVWGLPGGTGAYQKLLGLCQDPQECWLFWLCSPLVPPPSHGMVLMSIPKLPVALLERCHVLKRTETNQQSAGFLSALQVRDPGTAEDPALQTAKPGCLVRAKSGEKAAWQN